MLKDVSAIRLAEWCRDERRDGNGGCGACSICCTELRDERDALRLEVESLRKDKERLRSFASKLAVGFVESMCEIYELTGDEMLEQELAGVYAAIVKRHATMKGEPK